MIQAELQRVDSACAIPCFGERVPGVAFVARPGAYAIIVRGGRIAVVQEGCRAYLPGGGMEGGETPIDALLREVGEECGFSCDVEQYLGEAIEYVFAASEQRHFAKHGYFSVAAIGQVLTTRAGVEAALQWWEPVRAIALLSHRSHAWAVQQYQGPADPARQPVVRASSAPGNGSA